MNNRDNKAVPMGTKISPAEAEVWNAVCDSLKTDTYHMLQNFIYMVNRAAADPHKVNPDIQKLLAMLESDAGWQKAFNLCAPNAKLKVAQVVLILEQEGRKGFGAVMVDKPYMGEARMTECADDILERVTEVTMHGIYRRLRDMGGKMECQNLSDVLLTMLDAQDFLNIEDDMKHEGPQAGNYTEDGKTYAYGKKTKSIHRQTIEKFDKLQQPIIFTDDDRAQSDEEADR
jgi:hypothetical protein